MNRFEYESEIANDESKLMAYNLRRIDRLPRRGLLLFLDKETSKSNTERLRTKARLVAISAFNGDVDRDLTRIEHETR